MKGKKLPKNLKSEHIGKKTDRIPGFSEKFIRLLGIYTLIAKEKYPTVDSLAEEYEVNERTIYRDLSIINQIDPVELDKQRNGYRFTNSNSIKKLILSDDQLLFLMAVGEMAAHLGKPFQDNFRSLLDNIGKDVINKSLDSPVPLSIKIPNVIVNDKTTEYYERIINCIKEQRSIDIVYHTLYSGQEKDRRIDPYGLIFYEGAWLVNAYCHMREEIRNFAIDQILELKETYFYFRKKQDYNLDEECKHSWGIYKADPVEIIIRFSKEAATQIMRRDKWHPSETRQILSSGEIELTLTVAGIDEISRWIYSWLPMVEVVKPAWFREKVHKDIIKVLQKHR